VYVTVQRVDGERRLAAFAVPKDGATIVAAEIRARLKERLGAASVPDAIVEVRELARRDDGTIDEARLAIQLKAAAASGPHADPRSADERAVADAWKAALNVQRVGLADNFFELGGHSLLAVQVTLKLEEKARLRIDPRSLFFQTLEQVAAGAKRTADGETAAEAS
jgi:acyl carrier protein